MPVPNADSNLLFGMTALQMDFITRDALFSAMQAWTFDKQRQLGDILIEQGALTDSQHELLKELVQEHLKQHDGDPQKSLAAIRADSSIGEVLRSIDDRDIQKSLIHFAVTHTADAYATRQSAESDDDGQRFRILRPHAQGGLGQISVALDKELHREVALKELQMKYSANEATRERFLIEAEITGGLEHPSIIPVYGLGHYSDGRPYYAMRFIRGDNLQEAIDAYHRSSPDARNLELHKLLRRFVDVCDAVQYAHSRGVLHRDLKPGNIMLGKYGETLLVDWGLAKPIDGSEAPTLLDAPPLHISSGSGSAPTSMGSVVGTPGYMSPEQAAGRLDLLGPASDVYGLGATLYHLLAGQAPFRDKLSDVLKKVERGEFQPPRQVNASIPPALEAVCLKAMQRRPEDRYASASRLAEDVEHWLADEPVSTWTEPATQRLRRWTRRHWNATIGFAAVGLAVIAVLAVSGVLWRRAYDHEQRQHAIVRQVVDDYFTEVSEATLLNQPGSQTLRRDLLQQALEYYEMFATDHSQDSAARDELGKAHFRIGVIKEAVESPEDALAAFDLAILLQRTLLEEQSANEARLHALGLSLNARGRLLHELGNHEEAVAALQQAIKVRMQLASIVPDNADFARVLANSHMNVGECFRTMCKEEAARVEFAKAQSIREPWLTRTNEDPLHRDHAKGSYNLGNLEADAKNSHAAEAHFSAAIASLEAIRSQNPSDLEVAEMLAISLRRMADLDHAADRIESALQHYVAALAISDPLAGQNRQVRQYQSTNAGVLINYAGLLSELDRVEEAVATYESARETLVSLVEQHPSSIEYRLDLAATLANLGRLHLWLEGPSEAAIALRAAMTTIEGITGPELIARAQWVRSVVHFNFGRYLWATVNEEEAVNMLAASHEELSRLVKEFPADRRYAVQRDDVAIEIYAAQLATTKSSEAAPQPETSADLLERIRNRIPVDELSPTAATRVQTMARLQWAAGQVKRARTTMQLACNKWSEVTENRPEDVASAEQRDMAQGDLGAILLDLASRELDASGKDAADAVYRQARDVLAPLVKQHPDDEFYRRDLETAERALGELTATELGN
ncbi:MAG: protein kinase [Planctomycetes bacterium]|nr:protein kinase [Planctomycetota bacterium]